MHAALSCAQQSGCVATESESTSIEPVILKSLLSNVSSAEVKYENQDLQSDENICTADVNCLNNSNNINNLISFDTGNGEHFTTHHIEADPLIADVDTNGCGSNTYQDANVDPQQTGVNLMADYISRSQAIARSEVCNRFTLQ